jgi:hypothetical protein
MLQEMQRTGSWPARQWKTPTATGWEDAELRLQVSRARVFDEKLRDLAREIHAAAKESVWASSLDEAKTSTPGLNRDTSVSMTWLPRRSRGSTEVLTYVAAPHCCTGSRA